MLDKLSVPGHPTYLDIGRPIALASGADGGCWAFIPSSIFLKQPTNV